jgi:antitoxin YefM
LCFYVLDIKGGSRTLSGTQEGKMTSLSASQAKKQLYKLVDLVKTTHDPVCIVGQRNSAYLVSEEDWRGIQETLYLESITGMRKSII